uniref:8-oxo-dGTP diphosphatase n=1 Tax=termite gut metagenome TaxID=433724 RepID=S0DFH4_9ZZZZ
MVPAVKAVIRFCGKYLIVKRGEQDEHGAGIWEFPGGKVEFGEGLEDALVREVREETGLEVTVNRLLYAATFLSNPARQVFILAYQCTAPSNAVALSSEHCDFLWADETQLRENLNSAILRNMDENKVFELLV